MSYSEYVETVIDPALPIVDAHHHLWLLPEATLAAMESQNSVVAQALAPTCRRRARYLLDEFLADVSDGHHIRSTVFVDAQTMYRVSGPDRMKSVGEVEFVNGIGAAAASGVFGDVKVCAGIVGNVDLTLSDSVKEVLEAHLKAGGGRYRGVRCNGVVYDEDWTILGRGVGVPRLLCDERFRAGFRHLYPLGLSFDALILEPQLPDLIDLARKFPDTSIILNHLGAPLGVGKYSGQRQERFSLWRDRIRELARSPNVFVKLGGFGIPFGGFSTSVDGQPLTSSFLASEWKPYIESCIETFGPHRCMFESNFPVDSSICSYSVLWNAFKRITAGASREEKSALFSGTAQRVYRLEI